MTDTATEIPPTKQAYLLGRVIDMRHPRHEPPTLAANHDLTLAELQAVLSRHGYPDKQVMRRHQAQLERGVDDDGAPAPESPSPVPVPRPAAVTPPAPSNPSPAPTTATTPPPVPTSEHRDPYITAAPVSALFADHTYQRELDTLRVARMAAAFDIALVGIIEVSQRADGRYAILDGQHRWATVRDHAFGTDDENPHLACRVHTALDTAGEAALYHQLNTTRKQLTGWDRWLARRGAGEQLVLDIEAVVAKHGCLIGMQTADNVVRATKACENVVALGGTELLDQVLAVIRTAYRNDQNGLDASIMYGLGQVLNAYDRDELDLQRLIDALAGILPRQLVARAAAVRELHKGSMDRLAGHVIVDQYNNSRGPKVAPFFERVRPQTKARKISGRADRERVAIATWAAANGLIAAPDGTVTKSIREAYEASHA